MHPSAIVASSNSKSLLFDYDGVVIRNKQVLDRVSHASVLFCQRYLHESYSVVSNTNKKYFPKYGHTVTMLQEMFKVNTCMDEYNEFVYEKHMDYDSIPAMLDQSDLDNKDDIVNCIESFQNQGISYGIYTNNCDAWVQRVNRVLGLDELFENDLVFSQDNLVHSKPDVRSYQEVEKKFMQSTKSQHIVFLDDNKTNLKAVVDNSNWTPIHVSSTSKISTLLGDHTDILDANVTLL